MKKRLNLSIFKLLVRQLREYWHYYLIAIVSLTFTHQFLSTLPFLARDMSKLITDNKSETNIWNFVGLALGIIVFRTLSRNFFFLPARIMQKDLRVEIINRLENASPYRYKQYNSGQLFQIVFSDIDNIRSLFGFVILQVSNIIIAMLVLLPKMAIFDYGLLLAIIPLFIAFFLFTAIVWSTHHDFKETQRYQGEVQNFIMESYVGKRTIKNYNSESDFVDLFKEHSWKEMWHFYRASSKIAWSKPLIPLGVGISFLVGAFIIRQHDLGAPALILFSGFVFLFLEPMMFLSWIGIILTRFYASWGRIQILVSSLDQESDQEKIIFEMNSSFLNNNNQPINLKFWDKEISLSFRSNNWTALIGATGCGKTEVLSQLASIIKMSGRKINLVTQSPYLYNDNIINNIFLGKKMSDDLKDQAYELLDLFALSFLASKKEELLKLEIGENGTRLSGGQAKRLALVRSILSDSEYLLWDDPFSSVDIILEKQIINKLKEKKILKDKTVILSSHRLSTVIFTDEVVYLSKISGIVERGETSKLLNNINNSKVYEYFQEQMV